MKNYIASTDHYAYGAVDILTDGTGTDYNSHEAEKWLSNWGSDYLLFYNSFYSHIQKSSKELLSSAIKKQLAEFQGGVNSFTIKSEYLKDYVKEIPIDSFIYDEKFPDKKQTDWRLFWFKCSQFAPELSAIALCLLSIGVSEAAVERSFSIQQLTHSKIRNRLNSDIVESEMRIRYAKLTSKPENDDDIDCYSDIEYL